MIPKTFAPKRRDPATCSHGEAELRLGRNGGAYCRLCGSYASFGDARLRAAVTALHPKVEHPRYGCCAAPAVCGDFAIGKAEPPGGWTAAEHPPICGGRDHSTHRPTWPCQTMAALGATP